MGRVGAIARAVEASRAFRECLCARRTIDRKPQPFVLGRDDRRGMEGSITRLYTEDFDNPLK